MLRQSGISSRLAASFVAALLALCSVSVGGQANPFFAFCIDTHDAKKRSLVEQATLLKELGYDGMGHLWLDNLAERLRTLDAVGLKLFQVYLRADIGSDAKQAYDPRLKDVLPLLKGRDTMLAVLVAGGKPSDQTSDPRAVALLRELAELAQPHGVKVALYPHVGNWLERVEDALRVTQKVDRSNVGVMFNLCHWLKVDDEENLKPLLQRAQPHLFAVSLNGCDRAATLRAGTGQWITSLDEGNFDMPGLLRALKELGYRGPIGLQCWGIPGDAREHLARSMTAWRELQRRLGDEDRPSGR
jgi:sugar phosphate isomerase/epimerase